MERGANADGKIRGSVFDEKTGLRGLKEKRSKWMRDASSQTEAISPARNLTRTMTFQWYLRLSSFPPERMQWLAYPDVICLILSANSIM